MQSCDGSCFPEVSENLEIMSTLKLVEVEASKQKVRDLCEKKVLLMFSYVLTVKKVRANLCNRWIER